MCLRTGRGERALCVCVQERPCTLTRRVPCVCARAALKVCMCPEGTWARRRELFVCVLSCVVSEGLGTCRVVQLGTTVGVYVCMRGAGCAHFVCSTIRVGRVGVCAVCAGRCVYTPVFGAGRCVTTLSIPV